MRTRPALAAALVLAAAAGATAHDAGRLWRDHIGRDFPGEPVWGESSMTWIKCLVPPGPDGL